MPIEFDAILEEIEARKYVLCPSMPGESVDYLQVEMDAIDNGISPGNPTMPSFMKLAVRQLGMSLDRRKHWCPRYGSPLDNAMCGSVLSTTGILVKGGGIS